MRKSRAKPVPGVICVAPDTVQIAKGGPHENGGYAHAFAFSLNGIEDFGLIKQPGEL